MRAIPRTIILTVTFLFASGALLATKSAISAEEKPPVQVLFTNVNIFDGFSDQLQKGMSVLVEDNHIKEVGKGLKAGAEAIIIDGGGRTMTPGLIDMHGHVTFNTPEGTNTFASEWDFGGGIEPWRIEQAKLIDSLCRRWGCLPSKLLEEDTSLVLHTLYLVNRDGE